MRTHMDQRQGHAGTLPLMRDIPLVRRIPHQHLPLLRTHLVLEDRKGPAEMPQVQNALLGIRGQPRTQELHDLRRRTLQEDNRPLHGRRRLCPYRHEDRHRPVTRDRHHQVRGVRRSFTQDVSCWACFPPLRRGHGQPSPSPTVF